MATVVLGVLGYTLMSRGNKHSKKHTPSIWFNDLNREVSFPLEALNQHLSSEFFNRRWFIIRLSHLHQLSEDELYSLSLFLKSNRIICDSFELLDSSLHNLPSFEWLDNLNPIRSLCFANCTLSGKLFRAISSIHSLESLKITGQATKWLDTSQFPCTLIATTLIFSETSASLISKAFAHLQFIHDINLFFINNQLTNLHVLNLINPQSLKRLHIEKEFQLTLDISQLTQFAHLESLTLQSLPKPPINPTPLHLPILWRSFIDHQLYTATSLVLHPSANAPAHLGIYLPNSFLKYVISNLHLEIFLNQSTPDFQPGDLFTLHTPCPDTWKVSSLSLHLALAVSSSQIPDIISFFINQTLPFHLQEINISLSNLSPIHRPIIEEILTLSPHNTLKKLTLNNIMVYSSPTMSSPAVLPTTISSQPTSIPSITFKHQNSTAGLEEWAIEESLLPRTFQPPRIQ
ncbi:hypothetical protein NEHOM01_0635 [Nematocida homosporus]|uniref:uncharacterized protein n=1 Tax=Nematocida homosporus TaxID=1912981 RepID=UPI002220647B|nr:uncharacterized protein NEHOM01_0635 [Nematocida homosporus]KAI5185130.1 hypothetical protein NEHOM01_0635 [Nematocida homosporus]